MSLVVSLTLHKQLTEVCGLTPGQCSGSDFIDGFVMCAGFSALLSAACFSIGFKPKPHVLPLGTL